MNLKTSLCLFLVLAAVILGGADENSPGHDLDFSENLIRVARAAEKSRLRKKNDQTKKKKRGGKNRNRRNKNDKNKAKKRGEKERKLRIRNKENKAKKRRGKNRKLRNKHEKSRAKKKGGKYRKLKNRNEKTKAKKRGEKKRKGRKDRSSSTVSSNCYSKTVLMMKIWKDVVSNFKKQNARMKAQNKTGQGKSGKKGLFAPTAFKLIDIGGGNRSNLSCGGVYGSDGAKQLGNLTKTLFDCEQSVNASCNPANFPQPNSTFIEACETGTTSFETEGKACLKKLSNVTAACECFTSSSFNKSAEAVRNCDASKFSAPIKAQLNKCKAAFSKCRKFEDDAVDALSACTKTQQQHTQKVNVIFFCLG